MLYIYMIIIIMYNVYNMHTAAVLSGPYTTLSTINMQSAVIMHLVTVLYILHTLYVIIIIMYNV